MNATSVSFVFAQESYLAFKYIFRSHNFIHSMCSQIFFKITMIFPLLIAGSHHTAIAHRFASLNDAESTRAESEIRRTAAIIIRLALHLKFNPISYVCIHFKQSDAITRVWFGFGSVFTLCQLVRCRKLWIAFFSTFHCRMLSFFDDSHRSFSLFVLFLVFPSFALWLMHICKASNRACERMCEQLNGSIRWNDREREKRTRTMSRRVERHFTVASGRVEQIKQRWLFWQSVQYHSIQYAFLLGIVPCARVSRAHPYAFTETKRAT